MSYLHNIRICASAESVWQSGAVPSPPLAALLSRPESCAVNLQEFKGIQCAFADQTISLLCNLTASKSPS